MLILGKHKNIPTRYSHKSYKFHKIIGQCFRRRKQKVKGIFYLLFRFAVHPLLANIQAQYNYWLPRRL